MIVDDSQKLNALLTHYLRFSAEKAKPMQCDKLKYPVIQMTPFRIARKKQK